MHYLWQRKPIFLFSFLLISFSPVIFSEVAVITSPDSTIPKLSVKDFSKIFLRSVKPRDSSDIVPVDLVYNHIVRDEFYMKSSNKTPRQVKSYITKRVFTGKAKLNKMLANEDLVKQWVIQEKNRIGYIDAKNTDDSVVILLVLP